MIADAGLEKVVKLTKFTEQGTIANIPDDTEDKKYEIAIKGAELTSLKQSDSSTSKAYYVVGEGDPVQELRDEFNAKLDAQRLELDAQRRELDAQRLELNSVRGELEDSKSRILKLEGKVQIFANYTWIEEEHLIRKKQHSAD